MSLWDMLRFQADKFISVLNLLSDLEKRLVISSDIFDPQKSSTRHFVAKRIQSLLEQLKELQLPVAAKKAEQLHFQLAHAEYEADGVEAMQRICQKRLEELRERIEHELDGKLLYFINSSHADLIEPGVPLFWSEPERALTRS